MKKNLVYLLLLTAVCFFSCKKEKDQENESQGTIQLGLSLPQQQSKLKSATVSDETPASIVITIADINGKVKMESKKVVLFNLNGSYLSEPLSLTTGNYNITKFVVLNSSDSAIYATPLSGSKLAYLVNSPLPIAFNISKDIVTKVVPEVLSVKKNKPEDFGYSSFSFDVVKTFDILATVMVYNESVKNWELTSAKITINSADNTIAFEDSLQAITNQITLRDNSSSFTLTVSKADYQTYSTTLTADELKLYFKSEDKGPLIILLNKVDAESISMTYDLTTSKTVSLNNTFGDGCMFRGSVGDDFSINWGDGITEIVKLDNSTNISHTYKDFGTYTVNVIGKVESITHIAINFTELTAINIDKAINLYYLRLEYNYKLTALDISKNTKIVYLWSYFNDICNLDISKHLDLKFLRVSPKFNPSKSFENTFDLSKHIHLEYIDLGMVEVKNFDLKDFPNLSFLRIENPINTSLENLDFSITPKMYYIYLLNCNLKTININANPLLTHLAVPVNPISEIDISKNTKLVFLSISHTSISQINIDNLNSLSLIDMSSVPFSQNEYDSFISNLLKSVELSPREGTVFQSMFPTGQAIVDIEKLKTVYKWTVNHNNK